MARFRYTALAAGGHETTGIAEAPSLDEAKRRLRARKVQVTAIAEEVEAADSRAASGILAQLRRRRLQDLTLATRQLGILLQAGMTLVPALDALREQMAESPLAAVLGDVRERVNGGASLAAALEEHPRDFSELYVNMIAAGEAAGQLETILGRLADMLERRSSLVSRVKVALAYPVFLCICATIVVSILMVFVVPSITKLFTEMKMTLPLPTVILMAVSAFVQHYGWLLLIGVLAAIIGFKAWVRTAAGGLAWDRFALHVPLFGPLVLKAAVARFARTMGVLLASGVSILRALAIVEHIIGNRVLADVLAHARQDVERGEAFGNTLRRSGAFPPIVYHMIATGEASGAIEEGLLKLADAYEEDVRNTVDGITALLEPVLILLMALIVGFIMLAILLPIFEINQSV